MICPVINCLLFRARSGDATRSGSDAAAFAFAKYSSDYRLIIFVRNGLTFHSAQKASGIIYRALSRAIEDSFSSGCPQKTLDVLGYGALSKQINAKCSFARPRDNEIRLAGIGPVLFPSSLAAACAVNEASETKGSIGARGVVIYRDAPRKRARA